MGMAPLKQLRLRNASACVNARHDAMEDGQRTGDVDGDCTGWCSEGGNTDDQCASAFSDTDGKDAGCDAWRVSDTDGKDAGCDAWRVSDTDGNCHAG